MIWLSFPIKILTLLYKKPDFSLSLITFENASYVARRKL